MIVRAWLAVVVAVCLAAPVRADAGGCVVGGCAGAAHGMVLGGAAVGGAIAGAGIAVMLANSTGSGAIDPPEGFGLFVLAPFFGVIGAAVGAVVGGIAGAIALAHDDPSPAARRALEPAPSPTT